MVSNDTLHHYKRWAALVVGLLQLAVGVAFIGIQVPVFTRNVPVLESVALGLWTGFFFLLSGACAVISCRWYNTVVVAVVMTTSIFSVLFCGVGLLVAGLTYIIATVPTGNAMNEDIISNSKFISDVTISQVSLFFLEGFLAIFAIVLSCQGLVCGPRRPNQEAPLTEVHLATTVTSPAQPLESKPPHDENTIPPTSVDKTS